MMKFAVLASVLSAALISANCANSGSVVSPSGADASAAALDAKRSGGGGKPSGGGSTGGGTISMVMVNDKGGDGYPSLNDVVTFNVSTTATAYPYVTLNCYVNGTLVLKTTNGIFPTSLGWDFQLGPTALWLSGAADCTANLEDWGTKSVTTLGSTSFHVNP